MDHLCPGCGRPLAPPDDICPRCALAQAIPPVVSKVPREMERSQPSERRMPVGPDRTVRRSLHMLLMIAVGLVLLLFAVIAFLVWVLSGM
jgi:predicted amidophosphoribosyltransferase